MSFKFASKVVALMVVVMLGQIALAQAPSTLVYQGRLSNQAGGPLTGPHTVTFRIYSSVGGGTSLWTETHQVTADETGVFTIELGGVDPLDESVFDGNKRYLGMSLDGGLEMLPRQLISSTAYALSAGIAQVGNGSITAPKLADSAVISSKLAQSSVSSHNIIDESVGSIDIAPGAVGSSEIATNAISGGQIVDKSVGGGDLMNDISLGGNSAAGVLWLRDGSGNVISGMDAVPGRVFGNNFDAYNPSNTVTAGVRGSTGAIFGTTVLAYNASNDLTAEIDGESGVISGGFVETYDALDNLTAGINGETGEVFGNLKSFVVADPVQPARSIRYSCVEGPEAAIYVRGQTELVGGAATISFPEHFAAMAAEGTITVSLTPRSLDSKGLAALDVGTGGMTVRELSAGSGSYAVDYVVYAIRKGFEEYQVYSTRTVRKARVGTQTRPQSEPR